jgi:photosystem II stability/assembly factor-like uncharacterized protein
VFLAVGTVYGAPLLEEPGVETTPLVLRLAAERWETVELPPTASRGFRGVAFSGSTEAWIAGTADAGATLMYSRDAGRTWADVTRRLPSDLQRGQGIRDILFLDAERGWLVSETAAGVGPFVSVTLDGGETWARPRSPGAATVGGSYALVRYQEGVALVRTGGDGSELLAVEEARFPTYNA